MTAHEVPHILAVQAARIGAVLGRHGGTLKRGNDSSKVAVPLDGGVKQRRLAVSAVSNVFNGGSMGKRSNASGHPTCSVVVTHDLNDLDREAWLRWRLTAVEHEQGVRAEVSHHAVQIITKGGVLPAGADTERIRIAVETAIIEAQGLVEMLVDASSSVYAEGRSLDAPIISLVEQYGMQIRVTQQQEEGSSVRIFGPPDPARDAAALLWACYVQGKSTAVVLQVPGQIQSLPTQMSSDFEADLQAVESEFEVEVHRYHTMLWIAGTSGKSVASAKQTLHDMLQFYLPDEFVLLSELTQPTMDRLQQDVDFWVLTKGPDCVVALDTDAGTAWICGKNFRAVQQLIEAAKSGAKPASQISERGPASELLGDGSASNEWHEAADAPRAVHAPDLGAELPVTAALPDCQLPRMLEAAARSGGCEALSAKLDPTGEFVWPQEDICKLSWAILEQFWADMEDAVSS